LIIFPAAEIGDETTPRLPPSRRRYHIDELPAEPFASGHTARRWGVGIKHADGTVAIEPDPWPA
jgi:hypothetical protein